MIDLHFIPAEPTPIPRRGLRVTALMIVVLVVGGSIGMFSRQVSKVREAARCGQCVGNLKQIGLAFHNYHQAWGSFPPAYLADANGKPMHSWRVLILPWMEQSGLYGSYNMAEPWDGPNNRKLFDQRPNIFHCPSRDCGQSLASYVAIVGQGTAFPGPSTVKLSDIRDGTSETILLVEVSNVDIPWTEPRDLDLKTMSWFINDPARPAISSFHERIPILFVDGMIHRLDPSLSPATLKDMTTIDGHEPHGPEKPH
jgi:hypothetical protein